MTTTAQPSMMLATALIAPAGIATSTLVALYFVYVLIHLRRLNKWWDSVPDETRHAWGRLALAVVAFAIPNPVDREHQLTVLNQDVVASLPTLAKMTIKAVLTGWRKRIGDYDGLVWGLVIVEGVLTGVIATMEAQLGRSLDARVDTAFAAALILAGAVGMIITVTKEHSRFLQRVAQVVIAAGLLLSLVTPYEYPSQIEGIMTQGMTGVVLMGVMLLLCKRRWGLSLLIGGFAINAAVTILLSRSLDTPMTMVSFVLGVVHGLLALALHRTYDTSARVWGLNPQPKR